MLGRTVSPGVCRDRVGLATAEELGCVMTLRYLTNIILQHDLYCLSTVVMGLVLQENAEHESEISNDRISSFVAYGNSVQERKEYY